MFEEPSASTAWQPITFRGVARFAYARLGRVLLVQFLAALICAGAIIAFAAAAWAPAVTEAIDQLPETIHVNNGQLIDMNSIVLADGRALSILIDTDGIATEGTGDIRVKFRKTDWAICSLVGCIEGFYPPEPIESGRSLAIPWWGAWKQAIIVGIGLLGGLCLFLTWSLMACIYMWIARLLAYFGDRDLTFQGAWKMCIAAQLPGAFFMAAALVLYGVGAVELLRLAALFAIHFTITWVYLAVSPYKLERLGNGASLKDNPFAPETTAE